MRCSGLRALHLSGDVNLDPAAGLARSAWERIALLSFSGNGVVDNWVNLRLPLTNVKLFGVSGGDLEGAIALADTLPGALEITFHPPSRIPNPFRLLTGGGVDFIFYSASIRSASNPHITRTLSGQLLENTAAVLFGMPSLTDRVVRLVLPLTGWDDFVGFSAFGPFRLLEELVLTLQPGNDFQTPPTSTLSCPRLKQLVLSSPPWVREWPSVQIGHVAAFAAASLSDVAFPCKLEFDYVTVSGSCAECSEIFTSCSAVDRELTHNTHYELVVL